MVKTYKHIAAMSETVWSGVYIVSINDESVSFQYGYQSEDGMVFKALQTRPIKYAIPYGDCNDDMPYFTYRGENYWLSDFMVLHEGNA